MQRWMQFDSTKISMKKMWAFRTFPHTCTRSKTLVSELAKVGKHWRKALSITIINSWQSHTLDDRGNHSCTIELQKCCLLLFCSLFGLIQYLVEQSTSHTQRLSGEKMKYMHHPNCSSCQPAYTHCWPFWGYPQGPDLYMNVWISVHIHEARKHSWDESWLHIMHVTEHC